MEPNALHDLTPAYALDALDEIEQREYEAHLGQCARCQQELAELGETASMLAYGAEAPPPPAALRERILETARAERSNVAPLRSRLLPATGAIAAVAACVAIGLGLWSASLSRQLDRTRSANAQVLSVLAEPGTRKISLTGDKGTLYVAPSGQAALVVARLNHAPAQKTYEAWVVENGKPRPAGTFDGGDNPTLVGLTRTVPNDALVVVTLESGDGGTTPKGSRVFSAQA
jgi:predicted anti-sigma-YlaC factor YlaD